MREFKINGQAQGTTYSASYFATDSLVTKSQIDSLLKVIDLSMSLYHPNSTINKFNLMPQGSLIIDGHMQRVLNKSFEISKQTNGLFDITVLPLMRFWGFDNRNKHNLQLDTATIRIALKNTMQIIGMEQIKLRKNRLYKSNNHIEIDLNGIAQGYSVDVVADFMEAKGIATYVFELGGEIRAKGPKPGGKAIKIGIERPPTVNLEEGGLTHIITFNEGAITTSGSYRNYISLNDKKYGHTINPKTGYPITDGIISATVFAKKAIDADGYDNALMLMPVNTALQFIANKKDLEAYFIYKKPDGKIADTCTAGFAKMISIK